MMGPMFVLESGGVVPGGSVLVLGIEMEVEVGIGVTVEGIVDGGVPVSSVTDMGAQFNT